MDKMTPVKAIRAYCLDCMCGNAAEVKRCDLVCPLWPYRMGRNPARAGIGGRNLNEQNPSSSSRNEAEREAD